MHLIDDGDDDDDNDGDGDCHGKTLKVKLQSQFRVLRYAPAGGSV